MEGLGSMGMRARRGAKEHPTIDQLALGTRDEQPSSRSRQRPLISWPWARELKLPSCSCWRSD
eukprot:2085750-Heterocapsa_arctica.AAC.1